MEKLEIEIPSRKKLIKEVYKAAIKYHQEMLYEERKENSNVPMDKFLEQFRHDVISRLNVDECLKDIKDSLKDIDSFVSVIEKFLVLSKEKHIWEKIRLNLLKDFSKFEKMYIKNPYNAIWEVVIV